MSVAISIENLVHRYKDADQVAVNDISLEIKEGEIFGLLGPNGAGKTTTISILSGLIRPAQGKILIHGFDVMQQSDESKKSDWCGTAGNSPLPYPYCKRKS
jgi:ABC-2 type transport system ATP-binding protein